MAIEKSNPPSARKLRIGLLGCGFMGKCHTNAYKKIPYIYASAKLMPRLMVLCDQKADVVEREAARYGYEAVLHRLAGAGRRSADRRVRQLRARSGASASRASPHWSTAST